MNGMAGQLTIIGGGVMGLSVAYHALRSQWQVAVLEHGNVPTQASWAGAGILTAANPAQSSHPLDRLCGQSNEIHERWSRDLLAETGIDNEYRRCGGYHVAASPGEVAALAGAVHQWHENGVAAHWVDVVELKRIFGAAFDPRQRLLRAVHVPDERQLRNPRHLQALRQAILLRGGKIAELATEVTLVRDHDQLAIKMPTGQIEYAEHLCICAGAWSQRLLQPCGIHLPVTPVRGQMLLYRLDQPLCEPIIHEGNRYVVPRRDGHVLVGSTVEEVGFDGSTSREGLQSLQQFAQQLHASLQPNRIVHSWAGLRPASFDGLPFLGRLPGIENTVVATAQFRNGLQLAPVFAELVIDILTHRSVPPEIELLSPRRACTDAASPRAVNAAMD